MRTGIEGRPVELRGVGERRVMVREGVRRRGRAWTVSQVDVRVVWVLRAAIVWRDDLGRRGGAGCDYFLWREVEWFPLWGRVWKCPALSRLNLS